MLSTRNRLTIIGDYFSCVENMSNRLMNSIFRSARTELSSVSLGNGECQHRNHMIQARKLTLGRREKKGCVNIFINVYQRKEETSNMDDSWIREK